MLPKRPLFLLYTLSSLGEKSSERRTETLSPAKMSTVMTRFLEWANDSAIPSIRETSHTRLCLGLLVLIAIPTSIRYIKGFIMARLQLIPRKPHQEETVSSVVAEVKSLMDEMKSQVHKDSETFVKLLAESTKEREDLINAEVAKYQAVYDKFSNVQASHLHALEGFVSTFGQDKESLLVQHVQLGNKESSVMSKHREACEDKIMKFEESLRQRLVLRNALASTEDNALDD